MTWMHGQTFSRLSMTSACEQTGIVVTGWTPAKRPNAQAKRLLTVLESVVYHAANRTTGW
jgi:hypothetical protein